MGQDVFRTQFEHRDYERFARHLRAETETLHALVERGELSNHEPVAGLELEAWLIDSAGRPAPRNEEFLARLGSPDAVTELGRFNFELNVPPRTTRGDGLARLAADLQALWDRSTRTAAEMGLRAVAIGILPTLVDADLAPRNLSDRARYRALNQQVLRQRHGRPNRLDIAGADGTSLHSEHHDVMLEAAATSFQVHLQLPAALCTRAYNAALIASAPMVALSANSPLLFGRQLWQETRIPLFEQSLNIGTREDGHPHALPRVSFGSGYAGYSLVECFRENEQRFEPLLPIELAEDASRLPHLRLHNGTIWRWNRPLVGFDADGRVHLRVEHRPMAAGPSLVDMMANLAFAIGLITQLAHAPTPPESELPFESARANFYSAAQAGLPSRLQWTDGARHDARELLLSLLQPAMQGLATLGVERGLAERWLAIVEARVASGRQGAAWQLRELDRQGGDLAGLTRAYADRQASGEPVHRWA